MAAIINGEYEELDDGVAELNLVPESSLPWLEAEEDDSDAGAFDTRQILLFAGGLLVLLALVVGIVWYVSNKVSSAALEPDGSIIAAPEGPIRERPEDPGGKEFDGTGNLAPVVGEGGKPQSVVASAAPPAAPAKAPSATSATPAPKDQKPAADPVVNGVGVQLAAYASRERAEQGWADLSRRSATLQAARYRIVEGKVDAGTVYRLQAVAADRAGADQLCATLKREGLDCQVKP